MENNRLFHFKAPFFSPTFRHIDGILVPTLAEAELPAVLVGVALVLAMFEHLGAVGVKRASVEFVGTLFLDAFLDGVELGLDEGRGVVLLHGVLGLGLEKLWVQRLHAGLHHFGVAAHGLEAVAVVGHAGVREHAFVQHLYHSVGVAVSGVTLSQADQ